MIVIDGFDMPKGEDSRLCIDIYPSGKVCIDLDLELKQIATASEPKRGRWIEEGLVDGNQNRYCRCSECGKGDTQAISQRVPYCWWCGAKMDGEENE